VNILKSIKLSYSKLLCNYFIFKNNIRLKLYIHKFFPENKFDVQVSYMLISGEYKVFIEILILNGFGTDISVGNNQGIGVYIRNYFKYELEFPFHTLNLIVR